MIVQFLVENNAAPIKYMVLQFLAKVKHCQRIWRGFNECTNARVKLLKLFFHKAEELNFQQRKKDLIAEAVERRKIEEVRGSDEQSDKRRLERSEIKSIKPPSYIFNNLPLVASLVAGAQRGQGQGHEERGPEEGEGEGEDVW